MFVAPLGSVSTFQAGRKTKDKRCMSIEFLPFYFNWETISFLKALPVRFLLVSLTRTMSKSQLQRSLEAEFFNWVHGYPKQYWAMYVGRTKRILDRQPTWSATGYTRHEIFFKVFISGSLPLSVHTYYFGYFAIFLLEETIHLLSPKWESICCNWMSPLGPMSQIKRGKQVVLCPWSWTVAKPLSTLC